MHYIDQGTFDTRAPNHGFSDMAKEHWARERARLGIVAKPATRPDGEPDDETIAEVKLSYLKRGDPLTAGDIIRWEGGRLMITRPGRMLRCSPRCGFF